MRHFRLFMLLPMSALLLVACFGGGSGGPAPKLTVTVAGPDSVKVSETVTLSAAVTGPGAGNAVVGWEATGGVFVNPTGLQVVWTAPPEAGRYVITIAATAGGASGTTAMTVQVIAGNGGNGNDPIGGQCAAGNHNDPDNPYIVCTVADLQAMSKGGHYALGEHIDAEETAAWNAGKGFVPLGNHREAWSGSLDGRGYVITGLFINRPGDVNRVGLFGVVETGTVIRNVGLENVNITGASTATGALVGEGGPAITNSYSTGVVRGVSTIGGLVGRQTGGNIANSYSRAEVRGVSVLGGLVGFMDTEDGTIDRSYTTGGVYADNQTAGGLVGHNRGHIKESHSTAGVAATSSYLDANAGGLVGQNYGSIMDSYSSGDVTGSFNVGGLAGNSLGANAVILDSYATGSVTTTGGRGGGLVGSNTGMIGRSYSTGAVTVKNGLAGGLVAYNVGQISDSYATGDVFRSGFSGENAAGGLVGHNVRDGARMGVISGSFSSGNVSDTGTASIGGLAGSNAGNVTRSYSTGYVIGDGGTIGGLAGGNTGTITHSYSTGAVEQKSTFQGGSGGLVGNNNGSISYSYSLGSVRGAANLGGLVGQNGHDIDNSYSMGDVTFVLGGTLGYIGGLVGVSRDGTITNSYSTGKVEIIGDPPRETAHTWFAQGGLLGKLTKGTVVSSYWNMETSGQEDSAAGDGRTTAGMQAQATFSGWDFRDVWTFTPGVSYPDLRGNPR